VSREVLFERRILSQELEAVGACSLKSIREVAFRKCDGLFKGGTVPFSYLEMARVCGASSRGSP
jgi:hypothetical protein